MGVRANQAGPDGNQLLDGSWSARLRREASRAPIAGLTSGFRTLSCTSMLRSRGPMLAATFWRRYLAHTVAPMTSPMRRPRRIVNCIIACKRFAFMASMRVAIS